MAFWRYTALHSFLVNITFIGKYRLRFRNSTNFVKVKSCANKRAHQPYVNEFLNKKISCNLPESFFFLKACSKIHMSNLNEKLRLMFYYIFCIIRKEAAYTFFFLKSAFFLSSLNVT